MSLILEFSMSFSVSHDCVTYDCDITISISPWISLLDPQQLYKSLFQISKDYLELR